MTKLMQTVRLTQIARMDMIKGRVIVYTQPLDTAAFRIAAAKRWSPPTPSLHTVPSSSSAEDGPTATTTGGEWTSAREARNWLVWDDCKGECYAFTRKASATATQEG